MPATTINSFPSLHSLTSPRSWTMAIIVLLHLGFFWALTNGLSHPLIDVFIPKPPELLPLTAQPTPPPPKKLNLDVRHKDIDIRYVPPVIEIDDQVDATNVPRVEAQPPQTEDFTSSGGVSLPQPVTVEPRIDARRGLSEPVYPSGEIRLQHEGTVLLSVHILANGRVGDVKLDKSSGYPKLDESALREARVWRFQPGTLDGAPVAMWKQVPITFRINK